MRNEQKVLNKLSELVAANEEAAKLANQLETAQHRQQTAQEEAGRTLKAVYGPDKEVLYKQVIYKADEQGGLHFKATDMVVYADIGSVEDRVDVSTGPPEINVSRSAVPSITKRLKDPNFGKGIIPPGEQSTDPLVQEIMDKETCPDCEQVACTCEEATEDAVDCPKCGRAVEQEQVICPGCGTDCWDELAEEEDTQVEELTDMGSDDMLTEEEGVTSESGPEEPEDDPDLDRPSVPIQPDADNLLVQDWPGKPPTTEA